MQACAECILCLLNRDLAAVPPETDAREKAAYQREVLRMIADSDPSLSTPQLSVKIDGLFRARFGERKGKDFAAIKRLYNRRMLALEPALRETINRANDPTACAVRLARAGNYIDFGSAHTVDDALLNKLLSEAQREPLDASEFQNMLKDLETAARAVYITDNAGEIVVDKLLLEQLTRRFPAVAFTVLVRGAPVLNDATVEDARNVGLTEILPVIGNGNDFPGTVLNELSAEAAALLESADVIIAKGQANFETLCGCGGNVYYLLLCKCDYFVRRFSVPRLTGLFVNERRLPDFDV